jgi:C4-dicarboxylate-specific signal transduction histidine kinase
MRLFQRRRLAINAVDAMSSHTDRKPLLSVKTQMHRLRDVLITVTDSETGIDPKDMNRIFEAFVTTKSEGMGMELSICRFDCAGSRWAALGHA